MTGGKPRSSDIVRRRVTTSLCYVAQALSTPRSACPELYAGSTAIIITILVSVFRGAAGKLPLDLKRTIETMVHWNTSGQTDDSYHYARLLDRSHDTNSLETYQSTPQSPALTGPVLH